MRPVLPFALDRRQFLATASAALATGCAKRSADDRGTLFVGDQRGGSKVVLQATGALDSLPYRIEWSAFPNAAPLLEALNAGAIDTGIGGDAAFIFAIGTGARIKAIGAQLSHGRGPVLVVRGDSPVRTIDQIAGMRIATPRGSISHNLILAALEAQGKQYDAVKFAFLSPQDGQAAMQSGSVDGWAIWDPNATLAERQGARIVMGSDGLVSTYGLMFARDGAIADKRSLLADYHARLYDGWDWAASHRVAYADLLAKETGVAADVWRAVSARTSRLPARIDEAVITAQQQTADRYYRAKIIENKIDIRSGFDATFNQSSVKNS